MQNQNPQLAPPGAGLPLVESLVLKLWYGPVVSKRTKRPQCRTQYESVVTKIIQLAEGLTPEQRRTKILVPRLTGLEDSSRYWSLNGVMEHLMIVGEKMQTAILTLASGHVPNEKADVAKVKPLQSGEDMLEKFKSFAPNLLKNIDAELAKPGMDADRPVFLHHPWFGPINAHQWYWLASVHQVIHYQQAKHIAKAFR